MNSPLACHEARLALSARRDGEEHAHQPLARHLAGCADCAGFERTLAHLQRGWSALDEPSPPPDLWARIEARLAPAPRRVTSPRRQLLCAAAALVGFLGVHLATRALGTARAPRTHLLERWLTPARPEPHRRLGASPEYRLLLSRLPHTEDER